MSNEMIAVRLTSEQKQKLEQLANQRNQTVSDVIRDWIDGDGMMDSIPPDLQGRVRMVAQQRHQSEANVIARALRYAFANHKDGGLWRW